MCQAPGEDGRSDGDEHGVAAALEAQLAGVPRCPEVTEMRVLALSGNKKVAAVSWVQGRERASVGRRCCLVTRK